MLQIVQLAGAVLILVPFVWSTIGSLSPHSPRFLWPNLFGGGMLAASAIGNRQWGFIVLESTWATVTLWRIVSPSRAPNH